MAQASGVAPTVLAALAQIPEDILLALIDDPAYAAVVSQNRQALTDPVFAKLWARWSDSLKEAHYLKYTVARPLSSFQRHLALTTRNLSVAASDILDPLLSYNILDEAELALLTKQQHPDYISEALFTHYQHRYDILGPLLPSLTGNAAITATLRAPSSVVSDADMVSFIATTFCDTSTVLTPTKTFHSECLRFLVETRPHLVPALLQGPRSMVLHTAVAESPVISDPAVLNALISEPTIPVPSYIRDALIANPVAPLELRRSLAQVSPHNQVTRLVKVYNFTLPANYAEVTNPEHITKLVNVLSAFNSSPTNAWRLLELLRSPAVTPEQTFTIMAYLIQPAVRDCIGYQRAVSAQRDLLKRHRFHSVFRDYQVLSNTPPDPELRRPARAGSHITEATTVNTLIEGTLPFDARPLAKILGTSRHTWTQFFILLDHVDVYTPILTVASTVHRLSLPAPV